MTNHWLESLRSREAKLVQSIAELQADLLSVRRLIAREEAPFEALTRDLVPSNRARKPSEAVRELFRSDPPKHWRAPEVRDAVQLLRDQGRVASESANLLTTVHSILQRLLTDEFIGKDQFGYFLRERKET